MKEIQTETSFWIVMPTSQNKEIPKTWEIIEIWTLPKEIELKIWDTIFFRQYSPTEIEVDWNDYLILEAKDVLAKIEK